MNVWRRGCAALSELDALDRASALSGQAPERCASVLRAILDSAREYDRDGFFCVDCDSVAFSVGCSPHAVIWIAAVFLDTEIGLTWAQWVATERPHITWARWVATGRLHIVGLVTRWPDWAIDQSFSSVVN